jgi:hypothetical protein
MAHRCPPTCASGRRIDNPMPAASPDRADKLLTAALQALDGLASLGDARARHAAATLRGIRAASRGHRRKCSPPKFGYAVQRPSRSAGTLFALLSTTPMATSLI